LIVCIAPIGTHQISYTLCRVLPDTALALRNVLREAARLWAAHLGDERYAELSATSEGEAFFTGRVRLEPVPPEREMVAVWLPFPPDFDGRVRPQLVDLVEAFEPDLGIPPPPEGWPGWDPSGV
jgi:hypothetical protein